MRVFECQPFFYNFNLKLDIDTNFQFLIEIRMPISTFPMFECFLLPVVHVSQRKPGTVTKRILFSQQRRLYSTSSLGF